MNPQEKYRPREIPEEKPDDFNEIKEFLRKKNAQNKVLKKLINKPELNENKSKI